MELPPLSLGCAPLGGLYRSTSDDEALATLERAWELGIRCFDTAPLYGLGLSEIRLGRMLSTKPRGEAIVSTKVGRLIRDGGAAVAAHDVEAWADRGDRVPVFDFSYDGVLRSLDESLERLGLDRVDIVLIHDPDDHADEASDGARRALERLRAEGVVRWIGAGMNQAAMLHRFADEGSFDCFLLAGRYTLLDRTGEGLLDRCAELGIAVLAGGVFNSGLLAGGSTFDYAPAPPERLAQARAVAGRCERAGVPLRAAAMRFPARHPAVATVLVGARTPQEIEENVAVFGTEIADDAWTTITEEET